MSMHGQGGIRRTYDSKKGGMKKRLCTDAERAVIIVANRTK